MKTMLIMRGIPGQGKSFLAQQIESYNPSWVKTEIFSTDNFWKLSDGTYRFDMKRLGIAHEWNQQQVKNAYARHAYAVPECVIIDNTNLTFSEVKPYLDIAKNEKVAVFEVVPNTPWMYNVDELVKRNQHNVPRETIERMLKKFEPALQGRIMDYLLS